ncbi:MAG: 2-isopropylmalate synthase [Armatimonadota bacterium]|nr:2-isopropylmalate synthase [Armatimonadota bacterium]MDR7570765.1 2-isopropylmalate synthase [Armatimonadota bacterium]MDR7614310.1 2-isopropylmalate synthase [Armatimonadota bacterium]
MTDRVYIFDTTLRDGEQSPGFSMTVHEKLEMARALARLRVDVIEAGFPISSPGDLAAVQLIAREVRGPVICGLARAHPKDIEACWEGVREAERPRIHTFIATSPIHMERKLRMRPDEVLEAARAAVRLARRLCPEVEFSCEDATRSEVDFLCRVVEAAIAEGAAVINIPDTVGYTTPEEYAALIRTLRERVPNSDRVIWSVHCHDDLGLAVANSLAGIRAGARQVEATINGIGERAGNAALEEIVMALHVRRDQFGVRTGVDTTQIYPTSRLLVAITGVEVQPNKAIVGANAFAHEAGIHQHGVLSDPRTYEIMTPASVGVPTNKLVLGKHSGRHALAHTLQQMGFSLTEEEMERVYTRFKVLCDRKKRVEVGDLVALVQEGVTAPPETYRLVSFRVSTASDEPPHAAVRLEVGGRTVVAEATGDGPVDALFAAIQAASGQRVELLDYSLRSATGGSDALGEAVCRLRKEDRVATGRGSSTDVLEASALAYLAALNKLAEQLPQPRRAPTQTAVG